MSHIVSFSEIDCFRQCPHKHELAYKQRWQSPSIGPALSRGILWHAVMEAHYRYIMELQQQHHGEWTKHFDAGLLLAERINPMLHNDIGGQTEDQQLVEWMYEGYVAHYGLDPEWRILGVEHAAVVTLPTPRGTPSQKKLKIKIDLIVRDSQKRLWIVDHKSGKNLPKDKELDIDDQFGLYTWGMRKLGQDVFGSLHNAARTHRNKDQVAHPQPLEERHSRTRLVRTPTELDTLAIEAYRTASRAYAIKPGEAERAPNSDTCRWRCDFTEPCLASRKGIIPEDEMLTDMGFVQDFTRH